MKAKATVFKTPAIIPDHGIKTMADKGVRVMLDTQELSPEQMAGLFSLKGEFGNFYFATGHVKAEELTIPDYKPEFKGDKTPSQRLRAVLYLLWKQAGEKGDKEDHYRSKMESIIEQLKERLE